ncbi:MAG: response regulator [Anaerolineae bacterium]|nr:response regulator [Anaerolineae bacterium]
MEKKYTILYIDDNCDNRVLIERFLSFEGFEVHAVATGQQGLDLAAEILPDVFLIDVHLPDINGYEVIEILNSRHETRSIPKIIFSASDSQPEGKKVNYDHFIGKPLDVNTLAEQIKYVIQHPRTLPKI